MARGIARQLSLFILLTWLYLCRLARAETAAGPAVGATTGTLSPRLIVPSPSPDNPQDEKLLDPAGQRNDELATRFEQSPASARRQRRALPEEIQKFRFNAPRSSATNSAPALSAPSPSTYGLESSPLPDKDKATVQPITPPSQPSEPTSPDDFDLADIVLVLTVDGSIHGLRRSTGQWVWTLHDTESDDGGELLSPSRSGRPLVQSRGRSGTVTNLGTSTASTSVAFNGTGRTFGGDGGSGRGGGSGSARKERGAGDEEEEETEIYVIEPHSDGDIYVYMRDTEGAPGSKSGTLQKLPLPITQLVSLSPFTFPADDSRMFVGKKETKLVGVDLKTGRTVGIFGTEAGWCDWSQGMGQMGGGRAGGSAEECEERIQNRPGDLLYLGRTEYQLSIYSKQTGTLVQTLSYTSYAPSNLGDSLQTLWTRTPDSRYLQSMHDGNLVCFRAGHQGLEWSNSFSVPVVSVFDVAYPIPPQGISESEQAKIQPLMFAQPKPSPSSGFHASLGALSALPEAAFVGRVGDDLFAMSRQHFPLVAFAPVAPGLAAEESGGVLGGGGGGYRGGVYPDEYEGEGEGEEYDTGRSRSAGEAGSNETGCRGWNCIVGSHQVITNVPSPANLLDHTEVLRIEAAPSTSQLHATNAPTTRPTAHSIEPVVGGRSATSRPSTRISLGDLFGDKVKRLGDSAVERRGSTRLFVLAFFLFGVFWAGKSWAEKNGRSWSVASPTAKGPAKVKDRGETGEDVGADFDVDLIPGPEEEGTSAAAAVTPKTVYIPPSEKELPALPVVEEEADVQDQDGDGDRDQDDDREEDKGDPSPRKKSRRRRGKRKPKGSTTGTNANAIDSKVFGDAISPALPGSPEGNGADTVPLDVVAPPPLLLRRMSLEPFDSDAPPLTPSRIGSLQVSDSILGYGSHGTVVLRGTFQGRAVAVKRLLKDFVTVAQHEVSLLQESDDHPNVIRYFAKEQQDNFLYIALELCPASLADVIEQPAVHADLVAEFEPKKALRQITNGLRHLHKLKIVHRDIKPQNILVARGKHTGLRMLISDFGLCKKLDLEESSFAQTGNHAAGSFGYRAPEVLRGEVNPNEQGGSRTPSSSTQSSSVGGQVPAPLSEPQRRLTRSIDIFALGCIFYYTLTKGEHPFGGRFEREINIIKGQSSLDFLTGLGEEATEAQDVISLMIAAEASQRPTSENVLLHPFFWTPTRRLLFVCDASDRFEIMERDPPAPALQDLESKSLEIVGNDWYKTLDRTLIENLGKYRKYDGSSLRDLLRVLRNKKHHFQDLPESVARSLGDLPDGFLSYFTRRFPRLLLHVHGVVSRYLRHEPMFGTYFEVGEDQL